MLLSFASLLFLINNGTTIFMYVYLIFSISANTFSDYSHLQLEGMKSKFDFQAWKILITSFVYIWTVILFAFCFKLLFIECLSWLSKHIVQCRLFNFVSFNILVLVMRKMDNFFPWFSNLMMGGIYKISDWCNKWLQ